MNDIKIPIQDFKLDVNIGKRTFLFNNIRVRITTTVRTILTHGAICNNCKVPAAYAIISEHICHKNIHNISFYTTNDVPLTKDHIIPLSKFVKGCVHELPTNFQVLCRNCNESKANEIRVNPYNEKLDLITTKYQRSFPNIEGLEEIAKNEKLEYFYDNDRIRIFFKNETNYKDLLSTFKNLIERYYAEHPKIPK